MVTSLPIFPLVVISKELGKIVKLSATLLINRAEQSQKYNFQYIHPQPGVVLCC